MPDASLRPIGVFDSGVGGLSILQEIRRALPNEDFLYFADSAHCPYGVRPAEEIRELTTLAAAFLVAQGCKLIAIACNTASATSLAHLRATFDLPIVGLEPAVKPAVKITRNGRVGVLATEVTLRGEPLHRLREQYGAGVEIVTAPCPGLVEMVEAGIVEGHEVDTLLAACLAPMLSADIDTLVLGCTHYPFVSRSIAAQLPAGVRIIDSGEAVARQVLHLLEAAGDLKAPPAPGTVRAVTTGDPATFAAQLTRLLGHCPPVQGVVRSGDGWVFRTAASD